MDNNTKKIEENAKKQRKYYVSSAELLVLLREFQILNYEGTNKWWLKSRDMAPERKEKLEAQLVKRIKLLENEPTRRKFIRQMRRDKIKEEIGTCFFKLVKGHISKGNFNGYDEMRKADMESNAFYDLSNYIDRFDVTRDNPFAYFTQMIKNAFLRSINDVTLRESRETVVDYIGNFDGGNNAVIF